MSSESSTPVDPDIWERIISNPPMPMGPTEPSRASFKCGGGPHRDDTEPYSPIPPVADREDREPIIEPSDDQHLALNAMVAAIKGNPANFSHHEIIQADQAARQVGMTGVISPLSYTGADITVIPQRGPVNDNWANMIA